MKRESLTNREFDELGKRLIVVAKPDDGELDRLVSNPRLFDGVLAKIAAYEPDREQPRHFAWKPAAAMAMAAAIFSVSLFAYLKFAAPGETVVRKPRVLPYEVKEKPFVPDYVALPEPPVDDRPRPERAVMIKAVEVDPPRKIHKARAERLPEPDPVFHPIGLPERAEDAVIDGRVVRVEMPRSALFALGVDLPLENGTRAVKADLLVGADGIPRGIRLVE